MLITAATVMLTFLTATTPVWQLLVDLRGLRHRLLDGERAGHQRRGQRHAADRAGAASAVTSTSRQVGVSIGVALCGSVAGSALAATGADFAAAAGRCGSIMRRDSAW